MMGKLVVAALLVAFVAVMIEHIIGHRKWLRRPPVGRSKGKR